MTKERYDIYKRTFDFAVDTAKLIKNLNKNMITVEYAKQLIRSSGSIGANLEEADGAASKKDFINKVIIARKEAKESRHWLRLIATVSDFNSKEEKETMDRLVNESKEIMLILSAIANNSRLNH